MQFSQGSRVIHIYQYKWCKFNPKYRTDAMQNNGF